MKKFIFIINALDIIAGLLKGERYEGVLYLDQETRVLTFKAWNRKAPKYRKERKIRDLDFGWLGETAKHYVRHEKYPKVLGASVILSMMDRGNEQAKDALIDHEILEFV